MKSPTLVEALVASAASWTLLSFDSRIKANDMSALVDLDSSLVLEHPAINGTLHGCNYSYDVFDVSERAALLVYDFAKDAASAMIARSFTSAQEAEVWSSDAVTRTFLERHPEHRDLVETLTSSSTVLFFIVLLYSALEAIRCFRAVFGVVRFLARLSFHLLSRACSRCWSVVLRTCFAEDTCGGDVTAKRCNPGVPEARDQVDDAGSEASSDNGTETTEASSLTYSSQESKASNVTLHFDLAAQDSDIDAEPSPRYRSQEPAAAPAPPAPSSRQLTVRTKDPPQVPQRETSDDVKMKLLFRAVMRDDVETISALVQQGIDLKRMRNRGGQAPLELAKLAGKPRVAAYLVRRAGGIDHVLLA
eukprot:TRINITY_DN32444_c0_g1_i1.p1 TRINITY_DN32444_c0_g1~~TRINITY_DN32444_c0_g1_i1.p1  ORF type:complete len:362 (+),score=72.17 TRINITY_DN32444_c0_g1_i1:26-1111(+)